MNHFRYLTGLCVNIYLYKGIYDMAVQMYLCTYFNLMIKFKEEFTIPLWCKTNQKKNSIRKFLEVWYIQADAD